MSDQRTAAVPPVALPDLPARLRHRSIRRDAHGYPIPYLTPVGADGTVYWGQVDAELWGPAIRQCLCSLCGQYQRAWLHFIGGSQSAAAYQFTQLPTHEDCARFALTTCPHLAGSAEMLCLVRARGLKIVDGRRRIVKAQGVAAVEWWQAGKPLTIDLTVPTLPQQQAQDPPVESQDDDQGVTACAS